ncbi:MAG: FmdB family zinc ribbon protein [Sphaerochaetaceae bacterium]|jgi:putative FmdB family regulatory protein
MPFYEYECASCHNQFEVHQSMSDEPLSICPACNGKVKRLISPTSVIFKGSGFYINDSKGSESKSSSASESES